MIKHKLRLVVIAAVALLLIFLGLEYKSVPINDRAFVLGMGIDYDGGEYELTTEILIPSKSAGGGSSTEGGHKIFSAKGVDAAHALNDIFEKTGKLPSLGHCNIIILGENVWKRDVLQELKFFYKSDAFRGDTPVAVTEGTAKDLMHTKTPLENFTSISLHDIMSVYGKNTNTSVTVMNDFRVKMLSPSASAYLTLIKTVPAAGAETGGEDSAGAADEPLVFYDCSSAAVFNADGFRGILDRDEADGLRLFDPKNNFEAFRAGSTTVLISRKRIKTHITFDSTPAVTIEIAIKLKHAEAEELNTSGSTEPDEVTEAEKAEVKTQMMEKTNAALAKLAESGSDFLNLGNKFYARFGKRWQNYRDANPDYTSKIKFTVNIKFD